MDTAGPLTIGQLRRLIDQAENDGARRTRLFADNWMPRAHVVNGLTDQVLEFALSEWQRLQGASVLDYGCGTLPYRTIFELAGASVVAADIGDNPQSHLHLTCDGKLPSAEHSFDYVVSFQVLEHVPEPGIYLHEAYRVLKPGGKLFLTTHGIWPFHPTPGDFHRWTRSGLILALETTGFRIIKTGQVLNEYAALLQAMVMNASYRGRLGMFSQLIHAIANICILVINKFDKDAKELPSVLSAIGEKY